MLPIAFSSTDPRCHGNEIWDKISYNSACIKDFCEIFAPRPIGRGVSGMGYQMLPISFSLIDPRCHANEILDKIGYNSACVKNICEIFAPIRRGVSRMGHCMLQTAFFPIDIRCHGTKFGTKPVSYTHLTLPTNREV